MSLSLTNEVLTLQAIPKLHALRYKFNLYTKVKIADIKKQQHSKISTYKDNINNGIHNSIHNSNN